MDTGIIEDEGEIMIVLDHINPSSNRITVVIQLLHAQLASGIAHIYFGGDGHHFATLHRLIVTLQGWQALCGVFFRLFR